MKINWCIRNRFCRMKKILEIACFNYESAIIASNSGADRIEFCSGFSAGGLTPDLKETERLIKEIDIPVFVMIRPRNDFNISESEISEFGSAISEFEKIGAKGFVFGAIKNDELDCFQLQKIVKLTNLPCTCHRVFDRTSDLFFSLEKVIECGFTRILCSGGKGNALDNLETLTQLNEVAKGRITIMPGGGVRSSNIEKLLETGCMEFHSSGILSGETVDEAEIKKLKRLIIN